MSVFSPTYRRRETETVVFVDWIAGVTVIGVFCEQHHYLLGLKPMIPNRNVLASLIKVGSVGLS